MLKEFLEEMKVSKPVAIVIAALGLWCLVLTGWIIALGNKVPKQAELDVPAISKVAEYRKEVDGRLEKYDEKLMNVGQELRKRESAERKVGEAARYDIQSLANRVANLEDLKPKRKDRDHRDPSDQSGDPTPHLNKLIDSYAQTDAEPSKKKIEGRVPASRDQK